MILDRHPSGGQDELICECEPFFEPVTDLRPTKSHLPLELQGTCQSARPPSTGQPSATYPNQQNDPYPRWVEDLHHECKNCDHGQDFCIQPYGRLHGVIIDYMLESTSPESLVP